MKRLCRRLDVPLYEAVGILETLWHLTATEAERGNIGKLTNEEIAIGIDYHGDEDALVESLVLCGWLDRDPVHRLLIHDWPDHATDSIHMKLARNRMLFAVGQIPKTSRLNRQDRELADLFYSQSSHETVKLNTENDGRTKSDVSTDDDFVRTNDDFVRTQCAQNDTLCALPPPLPLPSPQPPPSPKPKPKPPPPTERAHKNGTVNGAAAGRRWPYPDLTKTKNELRSRFEDVGDSFVKRLYNASCNAAEKGGCKPELVTDALLASLVKKCTKKNQESAGLYLDTIPAVIETWAVTEEP